MDVVITQIIRLANEYKADRVILFGSRARGDSKERSDYDIAVWMKEANRSVFRSAVDDIGTLYKIDLVFITPNTSGKLLENIEKDGVILVDSLHTKYDNYQKAVQRLQETLIEYQQNSSSSIRDGAIQRFEFTVELAWKTLREYLLDQGYTGLNSPKTVMKEAFAAKLIDNGELWVNILDDRNLTSHVYDEETADVIFDHIQTKYIHEFDRLIETFRSVGLS